MLLLSFGSFAQNDQEPKVTGNFENIIFRQFVNAVEAKTGYRFYYDVSVLDSMRISVVANDIPIRGLLTEAFKGTDVQYAVGTARQIYVVKGHGLQAELPPDFFDRGTVTGERKDNAVLLDYLEAERAKKAKAAEERLYDVGRRTATIGPGNATVAGHVRSAESGEPLIGASIGTEVPGVGIATDQFGYYALTLPKGPHELRIKSIGMKSSVRRIVIYSDGQLDIELQEDVTPLKEVTIESEKDKNVSGMQMGLERLDIRTMKKVPVVLGEVDVLKVVLTLPGVQSVGEATTGLNVRGGSTNQNLILFNDATIYNPSHLFGFFSAFNPDVVKNVELYKSGIPAEYGGRLSSVLDITSREGNSKKFAGSGGLGPVTGRLTLEGPIVKDKTSFLIGGRSTYSDWLLNQIPNKAIANSKASFYDVNLNINHKINEKNTIYATGYMSRDRFTLNSDTLYTYRNQNAALKWKHIFNNKLYGVLTGAYSGYDYSVTSTENPVNAFELKYSINQMQWKADFNYYTASRHGLNFGVSTIRYALSPGSYQPRGPLSKVAPDLLSNEQGIESAAYLSDHFELTQRLSIYAGIRYSFYNYVGPRDIYVYAPDLPKSSTTVIDTVSYPRGKSIVNYQGPEYRLSLNYMLGGDASVKLSFNRMRQYLQMLSNTAAISPTDIWKLSDPNVKPQIGDQLALGFYKNFRSNTIETSVEAYYKEMQGAVDYKGGANLIMNHQIEADILNAQGKAYGVEVLIKKMSGKVNGWISYTYSRSLLRTHSSFTSETVNNGNYYPSNYDKPNAVNFIGNYKFSHRFSTSLNVTYSTGRPITVPVSQYEIDGTQRLLYSERNQYRIPDYFRIDFSMNIEGNHRIKKLAHSSWTIGVYNLTGRRNPYSIFFESKDGVIKGYKLSIFGRPIPTVTYNFRF